MHTGTCDQNVPRRATVDTVEEKVYKDLGGGAGDLGGHFLFGTTITLFLASGF